MQAHEHTLPSWLRRATILKEIMQEVPQVAAAIADAVRGELPRCCKRCIGCVQEWKKYASRCKVLLAYAPVAVHHIAVFHSVVLLHPMGHRQAGGVPQCCMRMRK